MGHFTVIGNDPAQVQQAALAARAYQIATIAALTNIDWSTVPALATNGAALALARTTAGDRGGGLVVHQAQVEPLGEAHPELARADLAHLAFVMAGNDEIAH